MDALSCDSMQSSLFQQCSLCPLHCSKNAISHGPMRLELPKQTGLYSQIGHLKTQLHNLSKLHQTEKDTLTQQIHSLELKYSLAIEKTVDLTSKNRWLDNRVKYMTEVLAKGSQVPSKRWTSDDRGSRPNVAATKRSSLSPLRRSKSQETVASRLRWPTERTSKSSSHQGSQLSSSEVLRCSSVQQLNCILDGSATNPAATNGQMATIEEVEEDADWVKEKDQLLFNNRRLMLQVQQLEKQKRIVESDLQEAREQLDLLEFRVLELEEGAVTATEDLHTKQFADQNVGTETTTTTLVDSFPRPSSSTASEDIIPAAKWSFNEEKLDEIQSMVLDIVRHRSSVSAADKTTLVKAAAMLDICQKKISESRSQNIAPPSSRNFQPEKSSSSPAAEVQSLKAQLLELERVNEELSRRLPLLDRRCSATESDQDSLESQLALATTSNNESSSSGVGVRQLIEKMERLRLTSPPRETVSTPDLTKARSIDEVDTSSARHHSLGDDAAIDGVDFRGTLVVAKDLATELNQLADSQPCKMPAEVSSTCDKCTDDVLRKEVDKLSGLLATKQMEMKNKEVEYALKLEALKYDREEMVNRLEARLTTVQQRELQYRRELDSMTAERLRWKEQAESRVTELELEREALMRQLTSARRELDRLCRSRATDPDALPQPATDFGPDLTSKYEDLKKLDGQHRQRIRHLESRWAALRRVLATDCNGGDDGSDRGSDDEAEQVLARVGEALGAEARFRHRISQLEKKEAAYRETLDEADRMVAEVERGYQERLELMEQSERRLRQRIGQLERNESRRTESVHDERAERELLEQRLMEAEAWLRDSERQLAEAEAKGRMDAEEELARNLENLRRTERAQQRRIEECEASESALRETLRNADGILAARERVLMDTIEQLQAQLSLRPKPSRGHHHHPHQPVGGGGGGGGTFSMEELDGMTNELQKLSGWEIGFESLKEQLKKITESVKACSQCQPNLGPALGHLETQMKQLHEIVFGCQASVDCQPNALATIASDASVSMSGERREIMLAKNNLPNCSASDKATVSSSPPLHQDQLYLDEQQTSHVNNVEQIIDVDPSKGKINELKIEVDNLLAQLAHKQQEMWSLDQDVSILQTRLRERECELDDKNSEVSSLSLEMSHLHEENEELRRKLWKTEVAQKVAIDKASQKNSEAEMAKRRVSDLEAKMAVLNKQLRLYENMQKDRDLMQDRLNAIELELKKKQELENRICAENLHLHHKVEGLRERVSSLQLLKRDHKSLVAKHSTLEKKLAAAELTTGPLNNQIAALRRECWDKERVIERLNAEICKMKLCADDAFLSDHRKLVSQSSSQSSDDSGIKDCSGTNTSRGSETSEDSALTDLSTLSEDLAIHRGNSPTSSTQSSSLSSDNNEYSSRPHVTMIPKADDIRLVSNTQNGVSKSGTKSRIPRYTALSSPANSQSNSDAGSLKGSVSRTSSQSSLLSFTNLSVRSEHQKRINSSAEVSRRARYNSTSSSDSSCCGEKANNYHQDKKMLCKKPPLSNNKSITPASGTQDKVLPKNHSAPANVSSTTTKGIPEAPRNFHVTRRVGQDGLLVAWKVPPMDESGCSNNATVSGYQIFINGELHQKVRSAHRTKALLNNLDFKTCLPLEISIQTLSLTGQQSETVTTRYDGDDSLLPPPKMPLSKFIWDSNVTQRHLQQKPGETARDTAFAYSPPNYSPLARLVEV